MDKVFTISFLYKGKNHSAVVTANDAGNTVSVFAPDESLHKVFPDGKISVGKDGIPIHDEEITIVQELIVSMMKAIENHDGSDSEFIL